MITSSMTNVLEKLKQSKNIIIIYWLTKHFLFAFEGQSSANHIFELSFCLKLSYRSFEKTLVI